MSDGSLERSPQNKETRTAEQHFRFPTPENFGKNENHTPIQTRILRKLYELKEEEKLNREDNKQSRMKLFENFDRTDTLLTKTEKQIVENVLADYLDIFARHRMYI